MKKELSNLVKLLDNPVVSKTSVISWGCPVPSFGDLTSSTIATVGLNPSNLEFVDKHGNELNGESRRFHTLNSLGLTDWSEVKKEHLHSILKLCREYFFRNPYDTWFKKLDFLISGTSVSYYFPSAKACHIDLIPYATACKWTELTSKQKSILLKLTGNTLGELVNHSSVKLLVLNGKTVVENFQKISEIQLDKTQMPDWTLPRKSKNNISGYAYKGYVNKIGEIVLDRKILVLGYNHNIQSSFGVTKNVQVAIRKWITETSYEVLS